MRWLEKRWRPVWLEKLPFLLLTAAATALGLWAEANSISLRPLAVHGPAARLAAAAYGLSFYLWKTALPVGLMPLYPLPRGLDWSSWPYPFCGAVFLVLTAGFLSSARRWPAGLAAWAFYVLTLIPVLGLIPFGPQIAADRYTYLSCLPWALLAAAPLSALGGLPARRRALVLCSAGLILLGLGGLAWRQTLVWRDSETLWTSMADTDSRHAIARNNLGNIAVEKGDRLLAAQYYQAALAIDPGYAAAHNNLGALLSSMGRQEEAVWHYRESARLEPGHDRVHFNLGTSLAALGRGAEAAAEFEAELKVQPDFAPAAEGLRKARKMPARKPRR
jgi:tetratricopeptide (TPR) repeat protein